jgi:hypothetical protein
MVSSYFLHKANLYCCCLHVTKGIVRGFRGSTRTDELTAEDLEAPPGGFGFICVKECHKGPSENVKLIGIYRIALGRLDPLFDLSLLDT